MRNQFTLPGTLLRSTLIAAMFLLAGCGGDDAGPALPTTPPASYPALGAQAGALHATWDGVPYTDPATLPASGSAQFQGVMGLIVETSGGSLAINGGMTLSASFATDALSGAANGFVDENAVTYSGALAIANGVIDRGAVTGSDYTYSATMGGTLVSAADSFAIIGGIHGDFHGATFSATSGVVTGTATSGIGVGYLFGDFIAD